MPLKTGTLPLTLTAYAYFTIGQMQVLTAEEKISVYVAPLTEADDFWTKVLNKLPETIAGAIIAALTGLSVWLWRRIKKKEPASMITIGDVNSPLIKRDIV
jgi:hypothetical protein